ncbi:polyprenyl diphosphate synthase [Clostridium minihomine]|uniref:polyprenyl diphosphate synthase n=1 Tax=Clostridium minihomine TaxID=2045012 RepID=UPI000C793D03|nr:polyprenyl diphosphate synthase [Clostridium minihomine]
MQMFQRLPQHIGIIPDGNRRWAQSKGLQKEDGYSHGIKPGFELYHQCVALGIKEITFYGFTQDNTKRPSEQTNAFRQACVDSVLELSKYDANLLVVGNTNSSLFPEELLPYTKRVTIGRGLINVNFLVNYGWEWDLNHSAPNHSAKPEKLSQRIASSDIARIDLIIRWGDRRRLSGFLPIQSIYADFYVVDKMWPDFSPNDLHQALEWYQKQDITLGG